MTLFETPAASRRTLVLAACDANFPVVLFVWYGMVRLGDPLALLVTNPWLLLTVVAFPCALALSGSYDRRFSLQSPGFILRTALATLAVVLLFTVAHFFVSGSQVTGEAFTLLGIGMVSVVFGTRLLAALWTRRTRVVHSALVVGAAADGCTVIDCTLREPRLRVRVIGFVDDDPLKRNFEHKGVSVVGTRTSLEGLVERNGIGLVIVAVTRLQNAEMIRTLLRLKMKGVEIVEMPVFFEHATGQCPIRHVDDSWFLYGQGFDFLHRRHLQLLKRGIDLLVAGIGLAAFLPLLAAVAFLIRLESRGPVFSRHERVGKDGKHFLLLKFRTMRADSAATAAAEMASVRDYRVTRVGRWLRLTRLDEMPQLLNVLRGEMSFVGPRAEHPVQVARLKDEIPYFTLRFAVRPGLTGWAQLQSGYGAGVGDDAIEKLKYDLYYIKNISFALDALILLRTLKFILFARGG